MGLRKSSKTVLGSTHVVEQFSFCMFLSILIFDFDLILGSFWTFWGPNGTFGGAGEGSTTVLWSTHVAEQLSFCMLLSDLIDFDLILGSFLTFWGPNWLFLGFGIELDNCFGVYSCNSTAFLFLCLLRF